MGPLSAVSRPRPPPGRGRSPQDGGPAAAWAADVARWDCADSVEPGGSSGRLV